MAMMVSGVDRQVSVGHTARLATDPADTMRPLVIGIEGERSWFIDINNRLNDFIGLQRDPTTGDYRVFVGMPLDKASVDFPPYSDSFSTSAYDFDLDNECAEPSIAAVQLADSGAAGPNPTYPVKRPVPAEMMVSSDAMSTM